jgi:hypothetical protein
MEKLLQRDEHGGCLYQAARYQKVSKPTPTNAGASIAEASYGIVSVPNNETLKSAVKRINRILTSYRSLYLCRNPQTILKLS